MDDKQLQALANKLAKTSKPLKTSVSLMAAEKAQR